MTSQRLTRGRLLLFRQEHESETGVHRAADLGLGVGAFHKGCAAGDDAAWFHPHQVAVRQKAGQCGLGAAREPCRCDVRGVHEAALQEILIREIHRHAAVCGIAAIGFFEMRQGVAALADHPEETP